MSKKYMYIHPADQIVEFMKRIYDAGMTTISGGNLSIKDDNGDMWISPSGVDKGALTRDDIVCVKADGAIVGKYKPSSEYPFHSAVYRSRKDANAVVHAHPPALVALSVAGKLPAINSAPDYNTACNRVGFAAYEVPGSVELGDVIGRQFKKGADCVILENHGACVLGSDMQDAFLRLETFDFCARATINAKINGGETELSAEQLAAFTDYICDDASDGLKRVSLGKLATSDLDIAQGLVEIVRRAYRQQLFSGISGELAVRAAGDRFLVLSTGTDRASAEVSDVFIVDGKHFDSDGGSPYLRLFFNLFRMQPELGAIMIATPPALMGFGVSEKIFDPRVIPESYLLLREMPTLPYGCYRDNMKAFCEKISPRTPAAIISNECVITVGKDPLQALDRMEVAEYSAKAALSATNFGGLRPMNEKQVSDIITAFKLIP